MSTIYTLTSIQDLQGRLKQVGVSEKAEVYAIQIGRKFPSLFESGRRRRNITQLMTTAGIDSVYSAVMIGELILAGIIHVSPNGKTIAFHPYPPAKPKGKKKRGRCVYCRKMATGITKDHVIPRGQRGSDHPSNIVLACQPCNLSKGCRTPEEWARDILTHAKPRKPMRRLPLRLKLRLVVTAAVGFVTSCVVGR